MNTTYEAAPKADSQIVYIRPVMVADLPQELQDQIGDIETVYSVHRPDGARVALVRDCAMAFSLARQHDFAPVHVH